MDKNDFIAGILDMKVSELLDLLPAFKQVVALGDSLSMFKAPKGTLYLASYEDGYKINVIKAVRSVVPYVGLKEAKDMVEAVLPVKLMSDVTPQQATDIEKIFTEAHAKVFLD